MDGPDRIEKEVTLKAPIERVWRALTTVDEFERWFGIRLAAPFETGKTVEGVVTARRQERWLLSRDLPVMLCTALAIDRPHRLRFQWSPSGDSNAGCSDWKPSAIIDIRLVSREEETILSMRETGLGNFPEAMRGQVLMMSITARHASFCC